MIGASRRFDHHVPRRRASAMFVVIENCRLRWLAQMCAARECLDVARLRATGYAQAPTPLAAAVAEYVRDYLVPGKHLGD